MQAVWLQGLDGEATEPIISTLADPQASQAAPEEEYRVAAALSSEQAHGEQQHKERVPGRLAMLIMRLEAVTGATAERGDAGEATQLIRLLHHAAQLQVGCARGFSRLGISLGKSCADRGDVCVRQGKSICCLSASARSCC